MIILIIIVFAVIAIIQIPSLVKKKYWKELVAFCVFFAASFTLCVLLVAGVKLPSPAMAIRTFLEAINLHF